MKIKIEVREVDAWADGEGGWYWNTSYNLGTFETEAQNLKKAITRYLRKKGIVFKKNRTLIQFDGSVYEVIDRKTKEPLFGAIPEW